MASFEVKILTPEREAYVGTAEKVIVRTTEGDVGIMAKHVDYVAGLSIGKFTLMNEGTKRYAALADGFITVADGKVTLLTDFFEWQDEIDAKRAEEAKVSAEKSLSSKKENEDEACLELKLKKAINRINVSNL